MLLNLLIDQGLEFSLIEVELPCFLHSGREKPTAERVLGSGFHPVHVDVKLACQSHCQQKGKPDFELRLCDWL